MKREELDDILTKNDVALQYAEMRVVQRSLGHIPHLVAEVKRLEAVLVSVHSVLARCRRNGGDSFLAAAVAESILDATLDTKEPHR